MPDARYRIKVSRSPLAFRRDRDRNRYRDRQSASYHAEARRRGALFSCIMFPVPRWRSVGIEIGIGIAIAIGIGNWLLITRRRGDAELSRGGAETRSFVLLHYVSRSPLAFGRDRDRYRDRKSASYHAEARRRGLSRGDGQTRSFALLRVWQASLFFAKILYLYRCPLPPEPPDELLPEDGDLPLNPPPEDDGLPLKPPP